MIFVLLGLVAFIVFMIRRWFRGPNKVSASERVAPQDAPVGARFVNVSGLRLRFTDSRLDDRANDATNDVGDGTSQTLVFIHGFFCCLETWIPLLQQISKRPGVRMVTVDLVGHGYSDKPMDWSYTLREQGRVVASLLEVLDLSNVILVGHSSGSLVAAEAASLSDRALGVVFVAPGFFQRKPAILSHWALVPLVGFIAGRLCRKMAATLRKFHLNPKALTPEIVDAHEASACTLHAREALVAMLRASEPSYVEILRGVKVPVHFVWSEEDTVNPPCKGKIDDLVSSGELTANVTTGMVEKSNHWIQHEQPEVLSRMILKFTESLV